MDNVNKLIFNSLASLHGVNMPGLGSLSVTRQAAQLKGRRKLTPPRYEVVYNAEMQPDNVSLEELIGRTVDDPARASEIYREWLAAQGVTHERIPSTMILEGVGDIIYNSFNISAGLEKALNTQPAETIMLSPRIRGKHMTLAAGCAVVLLAALFFLFHRTPEEKRYDYAKKMARELEKRNLERAQRGLDVVDMLPVTPPGNAAAEPQNGTEQVPVAESPNELDTAGTDAAATKAADKQEETVARKPAETPATKPAETPATKPAESPAPKTTVTRPLSGPVYHLVMGVFSTRDNAETFIRQLAKKDTSIESSIIDMSNGRFMVSGFASSDNSEVSARRNELASKYPDAWIYKQNKP